MKKLIIILALLVLPYTVGNAATFEEIIEQIRINIRDTGPSDSYRYTDEDMVRAINFVHSEISNEAGIPAKSYSTTTVAGQSEYDLPTDISGVPTRVSYYIRSSTSNFEKLAYMDINKLDSDTPVWEARTAGLPKEYYLRADKIGLYPAPSATYSTTTWNTLKIYYVARPTSVSTSTLSTTPFNGHPQYQSYSNLIIVGVQAVLTGGGYDLYYAMLGNLSQNVKENYDRFISRDPDRRRY